MTVEAGYCEVVGVRMKDITKTVGAWIKGQMRVPRGKSPCGGGIAARRIVGLLENQFGI